MNPLMQGGMVSVPGLPPPPALEHYLLESPWLLALVIVGIGVVGFLVLWFVGRGRQGLKVVGMALVLAGVLVGLAQFVETTREQLMARTKALVDAAVVADTAELRGMVGDSVQVRIGLDAPPGMFLRDSLFKSLNDHFGKGGRYTITAHWVGAMQAAMDGPDAAQTQTRVIAKSDALLYDVPQGSAWRVDWRREGDEKAGVWRMVGLTLVEMDGVGLDSLRSEARP